MANWPKSLPDYRWPEPTGAAGSRLVRLLLATLFHVAHLLGRIVSLLDRRRDRVLVIRTDGAGDGLLFEPTLRRIAASGTSIHLWAPRLTCELLAHLPSVHRRMVIPRGFRAGNLEYFGSLKWHAAIGFAIGRWSFTRALYPAHSPEPLGNWLLASGRADERWICDGDTINQFESQRSAAHAAANRIIKRPREAIHELAANQALADEWDPRGASGLPEVHLTTTHVASADAQVDAWRLELTRLGGREVIGVVPAGSMSLNSYPMDRWVEALSRLWNDRKAVPVLLGGPEDQALADELANLLRASGIPCIRQFKTGGILDMAALIARLDGVLSVDTGLAHLAIAQHVPTVVLVAGGNPGRFFPWPDAPHHVALKVATPCAGCNNRCTEPEAICITTIPSDEIVHAYTRLKSDSIPLQIFPAAPETCQIAG